VKRTPPADAPRRALMRETETPKAASRRLAERGDMPSAHASAAHPRILWVCPPLFAVYSLRYA